MSCDTNIESTPHAIAATAATVAACSFRRRCRLRMKSLTVQKKKTVRVCQTIVYTLPRFMILNADSNRNSLLSSIPKSVLWMQTCQSLINNSMCSIDRLLDTCKSAECFANDTMGMLKNSSVGTVQMKRASNG